MIEAQNELVGLSAGAAAALIREHKLGALELTEACLRQIEASEPEVQAFAFLDPEHAQGQARALDDMRRRGRPLGPLHGLPVGVKDIIDTQDMPTENGTVLHAGRRPRADATVVSRLRAAGAVILGKTVTTELAVYAPSKTRNPHNPEHTPGGSSSGSAAAVAAHMVPLALGTQTNGSVIRPAAYCGVYGYKPSHGLISRTGVLRQSPPLDTVGVMARSVEDLALLAEVLMGYDPGDPALRPRAHPRLLEVAAQPPPVVPDLGFVRTPVWDQAEDETKAAFDELRERARRARQRGRSAGGVRPGGSSSTARSWSADLARSFAPEYERGRDRLSARLCGMIERGQRCPRGRLQPGGRCDRPAAARDRAAVRALRRPAHAGDHRAGAAWARGDRQPGVLHDLDAVRHARGHLAPAPGRQRPAAWRPAGRPEGRRRPAAAHRALAGRDAARRGRRLNRSGVAELILAAADRLDHADDHQGHAGQHDDPQRDRGHLGEDGAEEDDRHGQRERSADQGWKHRVPPRQLSRPRIKGRRGGASSHDPHPRVRTAHPVATSGQSAAYRRPFAKTSKDVCLDPAAGLRR